MPIYEYRCPDCGHEFEVMQRMSDDPVKVCPDCSAANVSKLISRTSFVLKGGGWYKDHYGLKGSGDGAASGGSNGAAGNGAASTGGSEGASTSSGDSSGGSGSSSSSSSTASTGAASSPAAD